MGNLWRFQKNLRAEGKKASQKIMGETASVPSSGFL